MALCMPPPLLLLLLLLLQCAGGLRQLGSLSGGLRHRVLLFSECTPMLAGAVRWLCPTVCGWALLSVPFTNWRSSSVIGSLQLLFTHRVVLLPPSTPLCRRSTLTTSPSSRQRSRR